MALTRDDQSYNPYNKVKTNTHDATLLNKYNAEKRAAANPIVVLKKGGSGNTPTSTPWQDTTYTGGGPVDTGPSLADLQAKANREGKDLTKKQNEATNKAVDAKHALLAGFDKNRDAKLKDTLKDYTASDQLLLDNYGALMGGILGSQKDNDASESDSTFLNILNTLRERDDILTEVANQGAGETDQLNAMMGALRNQQYNQADINRNFFDSLRGVNSSITGLNTQTAAGRKSLFDQREKERADTWTNYYNQVADTWSEIFNIQNSNTNLDTDSSTAYKAKYADADKRMATANASVYEKIAFDPALQEWASKTGEQERTLTQSRANSINLNSGLKRPEGATLRKW